jgi:hypothetical protein
MWGGSRRGRPMIPAAALDSRGKQGSCRPPGLFERDGKSTLDAQSGGGPEADRYSKCETDGQ